MERIFVQIASYRDPELRWTLRDLFEKAAHPERVSVGLCLQVMSSGDEACEPMLSRPAQLRCVRSNARESRGACWARSITQTLWEDEAFTLLVDSLTRFVPGWDIQLLETYVRCPSENAVLSTYPLPYEPPDVRTEGYCSVLAPLEFDEGGVLTLRSRWIPLGRAPSRPVLGAFCGACFLFGPAQIIVDVPYDPCLYFMGEEISLAVRLWTHGWDIYHPNRNLLFHHWSRDYRPTHWDDVPGWEGLELQSRRRVNRLLAVEQDSGLSVEMEGGRYGLGSVRSLSEYQEFSGVDFTNHRFEADLCRAPALRSDW